ncbi:hypothetical protein E2C01_042136 [Portunus trituberculatus]|uniref:Uncharacterized protein n=1 Tax=Portunus trituberculatus TaxID=210409 RepID=A0A5B7FS82_PORTR|nr:hypothetical protein [Portunus trituberculatus]
MKKAPSLLLLLVVAAGPGSSPTPALAQQCGHESSVNNHNSNVTINLSRTSMSVYVRPLPGFKGISLTAKASDGEEYTACFPKQDTCFEGDADFWEVSVAVWASNDTPENSNDHGLYFRMWTDGCPSQCYYAATVDKIEKLIVTGHGPAAWIYNTPDPSCKIITIWNIRVKDAVHCLPTLPTETNTTSLGTIPFTHTAKSTARRNTNSSTPSATTLMMVVVVVVLGIVLGVLSVVAVRLALLVKKLKVSSANAGGAVCFSSLQEDTCLKEHSGADYSLTLATYPSLNSSTHTNDSTGEQTGGLVVMQGSVFWRVVLVRWYSTFDISCRVLKCSCHLTTTIYKGHRDE